MKGSELAEIMRQTADEYDENTSIFEETLIKPYKMHSENSSSG